MLRLRLKQESHAHFFQTLRVTLESINALVLIKTGGCIFKPLLVIVRE